MISPSTITQEELKQVLQNLTIASAVMVRGRGSHEMRQALVEAITASNAAQKAETTAEQVTDPETYVRNFIDNGGNWPEFIAAVSRLSLEGATRKN